MAESDLSEYFVDDDLEKVWIPQKQGCGCCKGYINDCAGQLCQNLGVCECSAADEFEEAGPSPFLEAPRQQPTSFTSRGGRGGRNARGGGRGRGGRGGRGGGGSASFPGINNFDDFPQYSADQQGLALDPALLMERMAALLQQHQQYQQFELQQQQMQMQQAAYLQMLQQQQLMQAYGQQQQQQQTGATGQSGQGGARAGLSLSSGEFFPGRSFMTGLDRADTVSQGQGQAWDPLEQARYTTVPVGMPEPWVEAYPSKITILARDSTGAGGGALPTLGGGASPLGLGLSASLGLHGLPVTAATASGSHAMDGGSSHSSSLGSSLGLGLVQGPVSVHASTHAIAVAPPARTESHAQAPASKKNFATVAAVGVSSIAGVRAPALDGKAAGGLKKEQGLVSAGPTAQATVPTSAPVSEPEPVAPPAPVPNMCEVPLVVVDEVEVRLSKEVKKLAKKLKEIGETEEKVAAAAATAATVPGQVKVVLDPAAAAAQLAKVKSKQMVQADLASARACLESYLATVAEKRGHKA